MRASFRQAERGVFIMLLLQASEIIQDFADRRVLDVPEFTIYDGDRIGLVGENGAGKSTLMGILAGRRAPDQGHVTVNCPIALVPQFGSGEEYAAAMDEQGVKVDLAAAGELSSRFKTGALHGGLSGGESTRRRITGALAQHPRLLMLDEPTTDLDAQGVDELMRQLKAFDGALLLISHDRALLDALCTSIAELEDAHIAMYPGNYSDYMAEKNRRREFQQFEYDSYQRERARLSEAIDARERRARRTKLPTRMGNSEARLHKRSATEVEEKLHKSASAMRTRLDQLERKERPRDLPAVSMKLGAAGGVVSRRALEVKHLRLDVPGRVLVRDVNFALPTGSRTALMGANGCGKTTLIGRLVDGAPGVRLSPGVKIGYFSQLSERTLDMDATALENAMADSALPQSVARSVLSNLMLGADDVFKPVRVLSGGERVKVELARLLLSESNLLILDEPTNHLDVFALEALEKLLSEYAGTLLMVSHDRRFVSGIAQRLLIIEGGTLAAFEGTLADYEAKRAIRDEQAERARQQVELGADTLRMRMAAIDARLNGKGLSADQREELEREYFDIARRLRALKAQ